MAWPGSSHGSRGAPDPERRTALVWSPEGALRVDARSFVRSAVAWWPEATVVLDRRWARPGPGTLAGRGRRSTTATVHLDDPAEWPFRIGRSADGTRLWTDGDEVQVIRFAIWARTLVAWDDPAQVLLVDGAGTRVASLRPAMTPKEVWDAWRPVTVP